MSDATSADLPTPEYPTPVEHLARFKDLCADADAGDALALGRFWAAVLGLLREPDEEVRWWVLADPEGNEFCAFAPDR